MSGDEADPAEVNRRLQVVGEAADDAIDLAEAALLLAALDRPALNLAPYRQHLAALGAEVGRAMAGVADAQADEAARRLTALRETLHERHGYAGDGTTYDDPANADLIGVIDRKRGLPVALSILYIHAARSQGWPVEGINFPAHFLVRIEAGSDRVLIDPFNGARALNTADLRQLLKRALGEAAELSPEHYHPIGNRGVLLRLLNNLRSRAAAANDWVRVRDVLLRETLIAPDAAWAWRELAQSETRLGNLGAAAKALETLLARLDQAGIASGPDRAQIEQALRRLKGRLH